MCIRDRSVYGAVRSHWEDKGSEAVLHVSIPVNTTATICLDGAKEVKDSDGLTFQTVDNVLQAQAGSGDYTVIYMK